MCKEISILQFYKSAWKGIMHKERFNKKCKQNGQMRRISENLAPPTRFLGNGTAVPENFFFLKTKWWQRILNVLNTSDCHQFWTLSLCLSVSRGLSHIGLRRAPWDKDTDKADVYWKTGHLPKISAWWASLYLSLDSNPKKTLSKGRQIIERGPTWERNYKKGGRDYKRDIEVCPCSPQGEFSQSLLEYRFHLCQESEASSSERAQPCARQKFWWAVGWVLTPILA